MARGIGHFKGEKTVREADRPVEIDTEIDLSKGSNRLARRVAKSKKGKRNAPRKLDHKIN